MMNKANSKMVARWKKEQNQDESEVTPDDVAPFFRHHVKEEPKKWPEDVGTAVAAVFFDSWRQQNPNVDLAEVPADLVMASGSGLDPHITLNNAHYQLDRVAGAWARKNSVDKKAVRPIIEKILEEHTEKPLGGLVGVPLVNVLEA